MRKDSGFTLVELILAIAIMAVLIPPLALGVTAVLRNSGPQYQRLQESHDAQIAAAYFSADAASAGVTGTVINTTSPNYGSNIDTTCDSATPGTVPVVRFEWPEANSVTTTALYKLVVYQAEAAIGKGVPTLRRLEYASPTTPITCTSVSNVIISHNLVTTTAVLGYSLGHTTCPEGFRTLTLAVTETSSYSFSVSGSRRTASC